MNRIKILYCIPALYYPSGMERVLTIKANYLAEENYEVHIVITDGKSKKPYYPLRPEVKVHQLDIDYEELFRLPLLQRVLKYHKKQVQFKKKLSSLLLKIKPDITISLLRRDINFITKIADHSIKIGEIHFNKSNYRDFTNNNLPPFFQKKIKKFWMNQLIQQLKRLKRFIVLSYEDQKEWTELNNTMVIHNPLTFYPDKQSTCINKQVIAIGRLVEQKGFDRLIAAWHLIEKRHPDWTLKIFGDGILRNKLENQIESLKLKNCTIEHTVPDIVDKYIESSIFVLSSRYEGFGMVIVEAMACGIPTVSFTCPCGPRDIIENNEDGILVENGNIKELAEKVCYLIENDSIRITMGKKARANVKRFLPENIMPQWISLFGEITDYNKQNETV